MTKKNIAIENYKIELMSMKGNVVNKAVVKKMSEAINDNTKTVMIAEAEKFIDELDEVIKNNSEVQFVLTTVSEKAASVFNDVFSNFENVKVELVNIYEYDFTNMRFDLIIAAPIMGARMLTQNNAFIGNDYETVGLENLLLHLKNDGKLVMIVSARILYGLGKTAEVRKFVEENYRIEEISILPSGTYNATGVKTALLEIRNSRVDEEDIYVRMYALGKAEPPALEITDEIFIYADELTEMGDWNVDKVFIAQDQEMVKYYKSFIPKDDLGNVAEVFRGKAVMEKDPNGKIGIVNISSIGDYEIDYENIDHTNLEERKIFNYTLREGDVLIPARGTAIRSAVFHSQNYTCIAHSNVIVIRPNENILDSTYLKMFLDSPIGKKMIESTQQGLAVMNISYNDLKGIQIPIIPYEEQVKRSEKYIEEYNIYKKTIEEAESRWKKFIDENDSEVFM